MPVYPVLTAWWDTEKGWLHVEDILKNPKLKNRLALLDQLTLELELVKAGFITSPGQTEVVH